MDVVAATINYSLFSLLLGMHDDVLLVHYLFLSASQSPVIEQVVHLSLSSLSISWVQPSPITIAQILYYEANGVTNSIIISNGSTTNYVLKNLRSGLTYSISLQALSSHLPSPITDPITTTLGEICNIRSIHMHSGGGGIDSRLYIPINQSIMIYDLAPPLPVI